MEYSRGYLERVLPEGNPSEGAVPPPVLEELGARRNRAEEAWDPLLERSTRWTFAILGELVTGNYGYTESWLLEPGWPFFALPWITSVGLFDPVTEFDEFGLIVQVPKTVEKTPVPQGFVEFPRLNRRLPLIIRRAMYVEHAPPHPTGGTSAAWAKCNSTGVTGVITAGHVVRGLAPGASVSLSSGSNGTLQTSAYPVVDAAFIKTSGLPGPPLPIVRFPAAGLPVVVDCKSGPQSRTVVASMNPLGVTSTMLYRILFHTDSPCSPGDSGALVRTGHGEAVGIYSGSLATTAVPGGVAGFNQNFEQAAYAVDVTAHQ